MLGHPHDSDFPPVWFMMLSPLLLVFTFFLLVCSCLSLCICIPALHRTRKWAKAKKQNGTYTELEANTLLTFGDGSDVLDTDDEAELSESELEERRTERENDDHLTFFQKWKKEAKKISSAKDRAKKREDRRKEREERRKLAKAVAQELRREQGRARASNSGAQDDGVQGDEPLPPYRKD
jgi:hypothetical protein